MRVPTAVGCFVLIILTVKGSEPAIDLKAPVLEFKEMIPRASAPDQRNVPSYTIGKTLLIIREVRSAAWAADRKAVVLVLNDDDRNKFAELTRKQKGSLLLIQVSEKPLIGAVYLISSPTEDGVIEFSEASNFGNIAEYLRHRFWQ